MLEKFDKNKSPFKVPENYFENFNAGIMDKLPEKQTRERKIVPLWKKIVPWTAVAAIFFGVLFTTSVFEQSGITNPSAIGGEYGTMMSNGIASSSLEDDYFLFIEDEVATAQYKEIMYSN